MTYTPNEDYWLSVAKGNVPGHSPVLIRGHNPSQTSASGFVDVSEFGDLTYLTAAEQMNIVSNSANDAAAGSGLRTVRVFGVDGSGVAITEDITMNGLTDVLTVNSYLRVNFLIGLTAGSSGWNEGVITATAAVAVTVQCQMAATESISQNSHYTVPLLATLFILRAEFNVAKLTGGSLPVVEFKGYSRAGGDGFAWVQLFDKKMDSAVTDELDVVIPIPNASAIARTDIRFRADTDQNSTEVRTRLWGVLVDD